MQVAGPIQVGQGTVGAASQAVGIPPGQYNNGFTVKALAANSGKIYVGMTIPGTFSAWVANTVYAAGARVTNGNNLYQCQTGGTSAGSGGPTGTGTSITDNGCVWSFVGVVTLTTSNGFELSAGNPQLFEWAGVDGQIPMIIGSAGGQAYCWKAS